MKRAIIFAALAVPLSLMAWLYVRPLVEMAAFWLPHHAVTSEEMQRFPPAAAGI